MLSATTKTRSPFDIFLVLFTHLRRIVKLGRYSFIHRLQNIFPAAWTALHFLRKFISSSTKLSGLKLFDSFQSSMWFGVNALWPFGSFDVLVRSLEFSRDSISQRNVYNDSSVKSLSWTITFSARLTDLIRDAQATPIHGITGELKIHSIWQWPKKLFILFWWKFLIHDFNSFSAPTKFLPLSERIILTSPRLEINRLSDNKNESVVRSPANSKWTTRVFKQVKITPYRLAFTAFDLVHLDSLTITGTKL